MNDRGNLPEAVTTLWHRALADAGALRDPIVLIPLGPAPRQAMTAFYVKPRGFAVNDDNTPLTAEQLMRFNGSVRRSHRIGVYDEPYLILLGPSYGTNSNMPFSKNSSLTCLNS